MNNLTSLFDLSMSFAGEVIKQQTQVGLLKATLDIGNMNTDFLSKMANPFGDDPINPDNYKDKLTEHQDKVNSYLDNITFKPAQVAARAAVAASESDLQVRLSATMAKSMGDKLLGDTLGLYSQIQDEPDAATRYQKTKALLNDPSVVSVMPPGVRGSYIAANERGQLVNATASGLLQLHNGDASAATAAIPGLVNKSIAPDIEKDVTDILNGQYQNTLSAVLKPIAEDLVNPNTQWWDEFVDRRIDYLDSSNISDTDKQNYTSKILLQGQQWFFDDKQKQLSLNETSLSALQGIRASLDQPNRYWNMPKGEDERKKLIAAADARIASFSPDKTEAKAAQTNAYKFDIAAIVAAVGRPADPKHQNAQGAADAIMTIFSNAAHGQNNGGFSIDVSGGVTAALSKLGAVPDEVAPYLKNIPEMLKQAYGLKPTDPLPKAGNDEMLWILTRATSMSTQGNKTPEEVQAWIKGVYTDAASKALKATRDAKLTGNDMVSSIDTMQSGGLANEITTVAGKQEVDPSYKAGVDKMRAFMLGSLQALPGIEKASPVPQDDGSFLMKAFKKGYTTPTTFRWMKNTSNPSELLLQERNGKTWMGVADSKDHPIFITVNPENPATQILREETNLLEKYKENFPDSPSAFAKQIVDLLAAGKISRGTVDSYLSRDPAITGVTPEHVYEEMKKRGLQ